MSFLTSWLYSQISTHTPHARRDILQRDSLSVFSEFQLTRLMRGVTQPQEI